MVAPMTHRARLALLAVAALTALLSVLALGGAMGNDPAPASSALVGASEEPGPLVATPARSHVLVPSRAVPLVPMGVAVVVAAGIISGRRPRRVQGLQVRLGDVGDAWRALLLGAPPTLL
jgi:hypothetical protein